MSFSIAPVNISHAQKKCSHHSTTVFNFLTKALNYPGTIKLSITSAFIILFESVLKMHKLFVYTTSAISNHFLTQSTSICHSTLPHEGNDYVLWSSFKSLKVSCWEPCIPLDAKMKLRPWHTQKSLHLTAVGQVYSHTVAAYNVGPLYAILGQGRGLKSIFQIY